MKLLMHRNVCIQSKICTQVSMTLINIINYHSVLDSGFNEKLDMCLSCYLWYPVDKISLITMYLNNFVSINPFFYMLFVDALTSSATLRTYLILFTPSTSKSSVCCCWMQKLLVGLALFILFAWVSVKDLVCCVLSDYTGMKHFHFHPGGNHLILLICQLKAGGYQQIINPWDQ